MSLNSTWKAPKTTSLKTNPNQRQAWTESRQPIIIQNSEGNIRRNGLKSQKRTEISQESFFSHTHSSIISLVWEIIRETVDHRYFLWIKATYVVQEQSLADYVFKKMKRNLSLVFSAEDTKMDLPDVRYSLKVVWD